MKKLSFFEKIKGEGKLELVEPSEDICASYLAKANDCLKSAKLLLENDLFENSISMSYYAMYNSLTALLFRTGIKCENQQPNHSKLWGMRILGCWSFTGKSYRTRGAGYGPSEEITQLQFCC